MNVDKAAEAMITLAVNEKKREQMGQAGRARVAEFYRNEEVVRRYRKIYDQWAGEELKQWQASGLN